MSEEREVCAEFKEKEAELNRIIETYRGLEGALIPTLHEAQDLFGYLPIEVQKAVGDGLGIPLAEVYGVVSFYSQFTTKPKGKYRISVCLGTACYVKGAQEVLDTFRSLLGIEIGECTDDRMFSLEPCRCIGACGLAPVVTVNDDVFGKVATNEVEEIIEKYTKQAAAEQ